MSPIATPAIPSKPRGELASNQGTQRPVGKDSPVIQPNLEIVGRSLDHHRRLETRLTYFFEGIRADVVYQAERMRPLRPGRRYERRELSLTAGSPRVLTLSI